MTVWIIEDDPSPHKAARRYSVEEREEKGTHVVEWPPRSPDLNQVEQIWNHIKDAVEYRDTRDETESLNRKAILEEVPKE